MSDPRFWKDEFDRLSDAYTELKAERDSYGAKLLEIVEYCKARSDQISLNEKQWDFLVGKLIREAQDVLENK